MSFSFNRVESIGQAVRNLVELGAIELLGRHAKVPYWQCLNIEPTNEKLENNKRAKFITTPNAISISETQKMLTKLGYFSGVVNGRMNQGTHKAISKFQAEKDLIATGDLNYDIYTRLLQEFNGYPVNGYGPSRNKPTSTNNYSTNETLTSKNSGKKHLTLNSTKANYRLNDSLVVNLKSDTSGYLYCFYQSGNGDVLQILPKDPNVQLQVSGKYSRKLPNKNDGFQLKFESSNKTERIMCVLQNTSTKAKSPFAGKFKALTALPVKQLEDVPENFARYGGLKDWMMVSKLANQ